MRSRGDQQHSLTAVIKCWRLPSFATQNTKSLPCQTRPVQANIALSAFRLKRSGIQLVRHNTRRMRGYTSRPWILSWHSAMFPYCVVKTGLVWHTRSTAYARHNSTGERGTRFTGLVKAKRDKYQTRSSLPRAVYKMTTRYTLLTQHCFDDQCRYAALTFLTSTRRGGSVGCSFTTPFRLECLDFTFGYIVALSWARAYCFTSSFPGLCVLNSVHCQHVWPCAASGVPWRYCLAHLLLPRER